MTQKEIWTGYWNAFVHILFPLPIFKHLFNSIQSLFKRNTPPTSRQAPPPARLRFGSYNDRLAEDARKEEIRKILNEMLNER